MSDERNQENSKVPEKVDKQEKEKPKKASEAEVEQIIKWVDQIKDEKTRERALEELSHKRESLTDLALYIWYSTGTVAILLQEIINTYQLLAPPQLSIARSNRACSVLALFQCVAAHPDTRQPFLMAQIPIFLYPFLNTLNKTKPYEYIRLTPLGVIGALVKVDNPEVITYLLNTEIIPLCLRIMERGSELSKTVACFIVQRILLDDSGLKYICEKGERLNAINTVLGFMINNEPSSRLIKHIIRSYSRLAENPEGKNLLLTNLPSKMKTSEFYNSLDDSGKKWLTSLNKSLNGGDRNQNTMNMQGNMNELITMNNMPIMNIGGNGSPNINMGIMDMNNNPNLANINPNLGMLMNPMNITHNQGYMMNQPTNEYFPMYDNSSYINNNMYLQNPNQNGGYAPYFNFQKN